ncbi:MAG: hypothetical protein JWO38_6189 [Gemmataceae bacterium]|nr:hypothetical protein [Gemmataceae bacterium]
MTSRLDRRVGFATVAVGLLAVFVAGSPSPAHNPGPGPAKDPLIPASPDDVSTGFAGCRACHNEKYPIEPKGNPFATKYKSHQFVLLGEGRTWNEQDPHSRAHEVLSKPLGQQMTRLLKYDVTTSPRCLTCHAIDVTPTAPPEKKQFVTADGVTCNACHGLRKPWQQEHYAEKNKTIPWRTMPPGKKEAYGLRNLRDPAVKAALCAGCHVGSAAEDKVITHEMYAAGHPPLPPFELATFMECQPKHWGYPVNPDLKFFTPEGLAAHAGADFATAHPNWTWELYRFHPADQEVLLARSVATGAIASLRAEMRMIAADAAGVANDLRPDGMDYARFDCYACHHDLKVPSDRQARGYEGKPGRPPLKAWVAALPGVVVEHAAGLPPLADTATEFGPKWEAVRKAALSRPFGDPPELARAADEMAVWCDEFLKKSEADGKPLYPKEKARDLLAAIGRAATSAKWTADPEAAMHLTWAYVTLRGGIGEPVPDIKLKDLGATIPVRVRFEPYANENGEPYPAGVQIGPRLDLLRKYQSMDFTTKFRALLGGK